MTNIEDIYELSPMQQGMLFHTLYAPESGVYFEQLNCTLRGDLNVSAFKQAWQQVVARHPVLRTCFYWEDLDKPLQVVNEQVELPWVEYDWCGLTPTEQQNQLETFLQADRQQDFELNQAPLMRFALMRVQEDTYQFVWSFHHVLIDGWSGSIIFKEVFAFYEALKRGQSLSLKLPHPYRDYIVWLQQQDLSQAEDFWRKALQGFTAPTPLVVNKAMDSSSKQKQTYEEQHILLSVTVTDALHSLAKQHHLTLNTLVQGAWALLLSRYSGESDVVFGATVSGRPAALSEVESMVGLFINTLPARVQVSEEAYLLPWLEQLQAQEVEREQFSYSPLVEIQGWSEVPRGLPLFDSILVFESYPVNDSGLGQSSSLEICNIQAFEQTNYPLTVIIMPGSELSVRIIYDSCRFEAATISRMLGHLQTLLSGMVTNPEQRISALPLLTEAERHQLLVEWNNTQTPYPRDKCIHQLFEAQVQRTPDAVAVVFEDQQLTYRELNRRANQLAHYLLALGVGPEVLVGLCVERSIEMVVGLLGILKAGGAYVPLDPAYPKERLAYMLNDLQVSVLCTDAINRFPMKQLVERLPEHEVQVVGLDTDWEVISQESEENSVSAVKSENLAYVIYTSGSTGKPKGVAMAHLPLANLILWQLESAAVSRGARTLQFAPVSFDVSFQEIFSTWCSGGTLVLLSEEVRRDAGALLGLLTEEAIERLFLPFVALQQLAEVAEGSELIPTSLREVITAGEQLQITPAIKDLFRKLTGCTLDNQYGPIESHVVTAFSLTGSVNNWPVLPPIGRPIANTQIYLLDRSLQPVPIGVRGELYIGGDCLARGYLNRPDLTEAKFIPNPFSDEPGARLYKTGDLARYLSDGNIEFLGRLDYQVKIRGFRVELGEIEAVLAQHPDVSQTMVLAREERPGDKRLVAYVVLEKEQGVTAKELRHFLKEKLPEYMVPAVFARLDAMPLTPSGKVDRRALPKPDQSRISLEVGFSPPHTPTEEVVAAIWAEVLGLEQVSIHDNFFELGGNSLLASQIISRLRKAFKVELPLCSLFELPTVGSLGEYIEMLRWAAPEQQIYPRGTVDKREEGEL